jgi:hypothetical protein
MPQLTELKAAIDDGKTAKHRQWRTILHYLVRRELGFYARQSEGYTNEDGVVIVRPNTQFLPSWELLVDSFGIYGTSDGWFICDDQFVDYLPPEREEAP